MRRALTLLLIVAAGCAANENLRPGAHSPETVASSINLSGFPADFRRGFTAGCSAARENDAAARPKGDEPYAVGWRDGFDYCKGRTTGR